MKAHAQIPADHFLEQVIAALTEADSSTLRHLEVAALTITAPRNRAAYVTRRATFAALLDATARNLRFLRRVAGKQSPSFYAPRPR